jgi:ribosomal protein S4
MFTRKLPAVVSMNHKYLAANDGSEQALGRGSGVQEWGDKSDLYAGSAGREKRVEKTPYVNMTFYPLERRLDTAIWRALFASSVIQARQFVVHGHVKVNGKKMIYPGYQLNPGDLFQVDPEKVMFATGARKKRKGSHISEQDTRKDSEKEEKDSRAAKSKEEQEVESREEELEAEAEAGAATLESDEEREALATNPEDEKDAKKAMKNLVVRAKRILEDAKRNLSGKRQQELRAFARSVKTTMSKHGRAVANGESPMDSVDELEAALQEIMTKIPEDALPSTVSTSDSTSTSEDSSLPSNPQMRDPAKVDQYKARKDAELLHAALERARANPIDSSKPYATPWKPRDYMSAFAFIPRYLEVNQKICSAVYLRHPVARPGLAEVPTPFSRETLELAFNWYLRRR